MAEDANLNTKITADSSQFIAQAIAAKNEIKRLADTIRNQYGVSTKEANSIARAAFNNTQREIRETTRAAEGLARAGGLLKNVFKGLAAGISIGAAVELFKRVGEDIDATIASAQKLDIATDQFQALSFAAKRSDVEISTLEQGLKKLRENIAKSKGTDFIAGVSAEKLKALKLNDAYLAVADSISKMTDSYKQAEAAKQAFGKPGQEQLNLLRNNPREFVNQFLSEGKGLSEEDVKRFNQMDKAADELAATIKDNLQKAFLDLGQAIMGVGVAASYAVKGVGGLYSFAKNNVSDFASNVTGTMQNNATETIKKNELQARKIDQEQKNIVAFIGAQMRGVQKNTPKTEEPIGQPIDVSSKALVSLATSAAAASSALKEINSQDIKKLLGLDTKGLGQDYINQNLKGGLPQAVSQEFNDQLALLRDDIQRGGTSAETLNQRVGLLKAQAARMGGLTRDENGDLIQTTNSGAVAAASAIEDAIKKIKPQQVEVKILAKIDKDGVLQLFQEGGKGVGYIKDAVKKTTADEAAAVGS